MRSALAALGIAVCSAALFAQIPGRNVNMVSGDLPDGDPYLQRQNEPSVAASTRNPCTCSPAPTTTAPSIFRAPEQHRDGDAWMGVFKSYRRRQHLAQHADPRLPAGRLRSTSPLQGLHGGRRSGRPRRHQRAVLLLSGIVFDRGDAGQERHVRLALHRQQQPGSRRPDRLRRHEAGDVESRHGLPRQAVVRRRRPAGQRADVHDQHVAAAVPRWTDPNRIDHHAAAVPRRGRLRQLHPDHRRRLGHCGRRSSSRARPTAARRGAPRCRSARPTTRSTRAPRWRSILRSGTLYLAWRRFSADGTDDSIMVTRSMDQGRKWDPPGRARRFPRGKKVGLDPEIHGKKFKKPTSTRRSRLARSADPRRLCSAPTPIRR